MLVEKKLRDVTPEEYYEYSNRNCNSTKCKDCIFYQSNCSAEDRGGGWIFNKDLYSDKFLDQTIEVEIPDILTKKEKEYLSAVIKPFRDKIDYIRKRISESGEYIIIMLEGNNALILPYFKENTMYKGIEKGKEYKLEELGL